MLATRRDLCYLVWYLSHFQDNHFKRAARLGHQHVPLGWRDPRLWPPLPAGHIIDTRVLRVLRLELVVEREHLALDRRLRLHAQRGRYLVVFKALTSLRQFLVQRGVLAARQHLVGSVPPRPAAPGDRCAIHASVPHLGRQQRRHHAHHGGTLLQLDEVHPPQRAPRPHTG